jgi:hypothetical protein
MGIGYLFYPHRIMHKGYTTSLEPCFTSTDFDTLDKRI